MDFWGLVTVPLNILLVTALPVLLLVISIFVGLRVLRFFKRAAGIDSLSQELQPLGNVTRYALASAVLRGSRFRSQVIDIIEHKYRAFAPELGLDISLLYRVCKSIEKADRNFAWAISGLTLVVILPIAINFTYGIFYYYPIYELAEFLHPLSKFALPALIIILFVKSWRDNYTLTEPFRRENFDHQQLTEKYQSHDPIGSLSSDNVICYGTREPMIGLGKSVNAWLVTVETDKTTAQWNGNPTGQLNLSDLLQSLDVAVADLQLPNLEMRWATFASGTEVSQLPDLHSNPYTRPQSFVDGNILGRFWYNTDPRARTYRWYVIRDWNDEIIISYMFRFTQRGRILALEAVQLILPPIAETYREIDTLPRRGVAGLASWFFNSTLRLPFLAIGSLASAGRHLTELVHHALGSEDRAERHLIDIDPTYNYGARKSIRDHISSNDYHVYFQYVDGQQYFKMIDQRVFGAVINHLDALGIDTSSLKSQSTVIIDKSTNIYNHGDMSLTNSSIGSGANNNIVTNTGKALQQAVTGGAQK